jgi:peptidoglycan/xylan/chitin deacetylase (PgdA/CDA1 family)
MEPSRSGPFPYTPINRRPKLKWPNGARVAVWVVPNLEFFPLDEPVPGARFTHVPEISSWATRDYGARVGAFRIMDVLSKRDIRASATLNSEVCDAYPEMMEDAVSLGWEFLGHNQSNTRPFHSTPPESDRELMRSALARIEQSTGRKPRGWLGSGLQGTWDTIDYLAEEGLDYVCDWVNDDQPYFLKAGGRQMVSLPYSTEINDLPQFRAGRSNEEFESMIRRQFDRLYMEGEESARVMAICIHPFVIGVSHRIWVLESALDYIKSHDDVWFATGEEIVDAWLKSGATF